MTILNLWLSRILAIESENKEDKLKWLTYWVIYGVFSIFECAAGIVLYTLPAYHKVKSIFLMWCMAPVDWNGSRILYMNFIRPFFYKHKTMMDELDEKITEVIDNVKMEVIKKNISSIFKRSKNK
ncbi:receptor expression-enhancing protein 6-like [Rhincodon typus]|uniref:receptor expression-enhancing protein 6-like n=1 Tax=Rhincodon typus TaxID=259920 RepID=UPI00202F74FC|nr:receptor expression-enhancing protein 6-like [Rhincodon typus]